jgi:hypothetical protein
MNELEQTLIGDSAAAPPDHLVDPLYAFRRLRPLIR